MGERTGSRIFYELWSYVANGHGRHQYQGLAILGKTVLLMPNGDPDCGKCLGSFALLVIVPEVNDQAKDKCRRKTITSVVYYFFDLS